MENKPVILIVEDESTTMDTLRVFLEQNGFRTLPATTCREAMATASHCPDLALLDLGLPDMDGMEFLSYLRGWSSLPVIVVTARQGEADIVRALDGGADDYVTKPVSFPVLMARIRVALRKRGAPGGSPLSRQTFGDGLLSIDYERRRVRARGREVHLTPIEYRILTLLARASGRVISHTALRRELWGPYADDNRLLRVNMANLRRKLEQNPADPRFILTEIGVGYRMAECDAQAQP